MADPNFFRALVTAYREILVHKYGLEAAHVATLTDGQVVDLYDAQPVIGDEPEEAPADFSEEEFEKQGYHMHDGDYQSPDSLKPAKKATSQRLLRDRHPQADIFLCDVLGASPKDDIGSMEHPIFSLSKRPDTAIRRYEHNNVTIEVTPSVKGIATIFDKDILIYVVSQLVAKKNEKVQLHRMVKLRAYDLLISTNRGTGGREYDLLEAALERLAGTRLKTDLETGNERTRHGFGLIESWKIVERRSDKRMDWIEVTLSDWLFRAVLADEVLTLHRDYFRLGSPIDRRLYEIARKHCGRQSEWRIDLARLQKKTGSRSALREFRETIRDHSATDHLPEYRFYLDNETDQVVFCRRISNTPPARFPQLPLI